MVRWYQQRKPVDLIQACREEADAARPQAPETPDFIDALMAQAERDAAGTPFYEIPPLLPDGWITPHEPVYSILNANGQECARL